jgi:hypothetical protein
MRTANSRTQPYVCFCNIANALTAHFVTVPWFAARLACSLMHVV